MRLIRLMMERDVDREYYVKVGPLFHKITLYHGNFPLEVSEYGISAQEMVERDKYYQQYGCYPEQNLKPFYDIFKNDPKQD